MSDLFEDNNEDDVVEVEEDFNDVDSEINVEATMENIPLGLDARRRLENMLDEKRLRDELDDFGDY